MRRDRIIGHAGIRDQRHRFASLQPSNQFIRPHRLIVLMITDERLPDFEWRNKFAECRVSSAAIRSTILRVASARRVISSRFPMGVPTMYSIADYGLKRMGGASV